MRKPYKLNDGHAKLQQPFVNKEVVPSFVHGPYLAVPAGTELIRKPDNQ